VLISYFSHYDFSGNSRTDDVPSQTVGYHLATYKVCVT